MNGYCKPKDIGFYKSSESKIIVTVRYSQKWKYQYGMIHGEKSVKVSRDNVILYLSKDSFEKEWEIIEKAEG